MAFLYVLTANLFFAFSSLTYTSFARKNGILWMNVFKAFVATVSGLIFLTLFRQWSQVPGLNIWPFLVSGFIGLALGDLFLVGAFARIGSARTMVLWGFQPIFVGIGSYLFFNEKISPVQLFAILLLISCLVTFSFESFKKHGHWEVLGLGLAMTGVFFDAIGLFFSRYGFQSNIVLGPMEAHFYRCCGAMLCFLIISTTKPIRLRQKFVSLSSKNRWVILSASFLGTFLAIYFSLSGIQIGHLPSLAALGITTPLFTSIFEHLYEKKWPSPIFIFAILQFVVGFYLLVGSPF